MSVKSGFFNSINKDRLYTAEDMNMPYKRIVSNGVFAKNESESSTDLQVTASKGMTVTVQKGNGIFKDKWFELTENLTLTLEDASLLNNRIDSIVVRIDESENVRKGTLIKKTGAETTEKPTAPTLENTEEIAEYRLANITINAGVTEITQADIEDTRPTSECGWIHNLLWDTDITATYKQWQSQFNIWFNKIKKEIELITGDVVFLTNSYTTTADDEKEIDLGITEYSNILDLIQVVVSGLTLNKNEFSFNDTTKKIILTNPLDKGTTIDFYVWHKTKKTS